MSIQVLAIVLAPYLFLAAIWYTFFWLFRRYTIDDFRERIFAVRAELFDLADSGQIPFNHPAYQLLRRTMNGYIRFAHQVSLFNAILIPSALSDDEDRTSFVEAWDEKTEGLDSDIKKQLNRLLGRMGEVVLVHMIKRSPILSFILGILILVLAIPLVIAKGYDALKNRLMASYGQRIKGRLDSAAMLRGA